MKNKILLYIAMSLVCSNNQAFSLDNRDGYLYSILGVGFSGLAMANFLYYKRDQWKKESSYAMNEIRRLHDNYNNYSTTTRIPLKEDGSSVAYQSQLIRKEMAEDGTITAIIAGYYKREPWNARSGTINEDSASKRSYYALTVRYNIVLGRYEKISSKTYKKYSLDNDYKLFQGYNGDYLMSDPAEEGFEYDNQRWWERSKKLVDKFENLNEEYTNFINTNINSELHDSYYNKVPALQKRRTKAMHYTKIYNYTAQAMTGMFVASICLAYVGIVFKYI